MLRLIGNPTINIEIEDLQKNTNAVKKNVHIYDARPYLNAFGNRMNGAGFESTNFYKNCNISFLQIENIHFVRDSYKKMCNICIK